MRAGKLQQRIQIERLQEIVADSGATQKVWLPILTTRAEIKEVSTSEFLTDYGQADHNRAVFLIRWPAQLITTQDRIVHEGKAFEIVGITPIGRKRGFDHFVGGRHPAYP